MNKLGKIYVLKDPRTNEVRYIGQTKYTLRNRFLGHIRDSVNFRFNAPKCFWIRKLLKLNLLPIQELLEEVEYNKLDEREIYWIKYYRDLLSKKILNLTDGGNNVCLGIKEYQRKIQDRKVYLIDRLTSERKDFVTSKEAAEFLKINKRNISKLIHSKKTSNGWYASYTPFPKNWKPKITVWFNPIILTDKDNNTYKFKYKAEAIRFTKGTVQRHKNGAASALQLGHLYRGYYWKYIEATRTDNTVVKKSDKLLETPERKLDENN